VEAVRAASDEEIAHGHVHGEHGHDHGDEGPDGDDQYRTVHLH
jgi:FKBP-type peptidyl-prolyl cis-trans isomerase SlyD